MSVCFVIFLKIIKTMKNTVKITGILVTNAKIVPVGEKVYAPIILDVRFSDLRDLEDKRLHFCFVHSSGLKSRNAAEFLNSRLCHIAMSEKGNMVTVVVPLDENGVPQPQILKFKNLTLGLGKD